MADRVSRLGEVWPTPNDLANGHDLVNRHDLVNGHDLTNGSASWNRAVLAKRPCPDPAFHAPPKL